MDLIAFKMLVGNKAKYYGLIFGVMFSTFLMAQQVSLFLGLMVRTCSTIGLVQEASIWVMDPSVRYFDEIKPLPDIDLYRVRGVEGVKWAVPFYKGTAVLKSGSVFQLVTVFGLDDTSLIGLPSQMVLGQAESIRAPNSLIMDEGGWKYIWPTDPFEINRSVEMNDHFVRIVGICDIPPSYASLPQVYTRYSEAVKLTPQGAHTLSYVLVDHEPGTDPAVVAQRIREKAGLLALTSNAFEWRTIWYFIEKTGIPINFGITVLLGFIVGAAIVGQTFYIFILENLMQFAALKAIGVSKGQILKMVLIQGALVGSMGYGLGMGLTALFFLVTKDLVALKGFTLYAPVMVGVGVCVGLIILGASFFSIRRVLVLDPAEVFRGP